VCEGSPGFDPAPVGLKCGRWHGLLICWDFLLGFATSKIGVLESVRIRPNPTLFRVRPNPEPISVGSKCPYRLYNTAKKSPAGLLGILPNPSESDTPPNPSESRTAIQFVY